ncbi:Tre-2/Bub2/Cdc16 (TBC) domain-containing protein A [Monocercomonoides exilis]|uniref:Tre-2/Bub2/Cdc16 (TBC) domain-containing protein A n=1 Tax=Monocercomonoides exilis TaxID=2049356 RepID=UPI003559A466|nr:Tre-2/Bub2/Cdc16 (TBC) domain-containing protein A [Monocercomonoides exilis]|eukprot:MONOS_1096.1-p1 / transcript=MONOS_1096.1 / gene=MONOS_1096 / organism=Monocercomonoides_exilis_PA203 / gene_product=Tre-2/Bub2/Cdc16 (TBC) domain-containing protein A / transcript_product=Tre-2/Bub2/Cdc16 (TBC) domain-containing protein A / location=Mono_scaffold00018:201082-204105(-) / protein_length=817 / sequence_SO=supercontig / SO=protein_coding / is_pseudo=false
MSVQNEENNAPQKEQFDRFGFKVQDSSISTTKKQIEKEMERTKKWLVMIQNWDEWMKKRNKKIKERCYKGIPDRMRNQAWKKLARFDERVKSEELRGYSYQTLLKDKTIWESQIDKDLHRTFPRHVDYGEQDGIAFEKLKRTLLAYAVFDSDLGYCQGMSYLAACLNMYFTDEESFWMLVILLSPKFGYGMREFFVPKFPLLHSSLFCFESLMEKKVKKLYKHISSLCNTSSFMNYKPKRTAKAMHKKKAMSFSTENSSIKVLDAQITNKGKDEKKEAFSTSVQLSSNESELSSSSSSSTSSSSSSSLSSSISSSSASSSSASSSSSSTSSYVSSDTSSNESHSINMKGKSEEKEPTKVKMRVSTKESKEEKEKENEKKKKKDDDEDDGDNDDDDISSPSLFRGQIAQMFAQQWFFTIFLYTFPFSTAVRIWDCFFFGGLKMIYRFGLGFLKMIEKKIMSCEIFEEVIQLIQHNCSEEKQDIERLVKEAKRLSLSQKEIDSLMTLFYTEEKPKRDKREEKMERISKMRKEEWERKKKERMKENEEKEKLKGNEDSNENMNMEMKRGSSEDKRETMQSISVSNDEKYVNDSFKDGNDLDREKSKEMEKQHICSTTSGCAECSGDAEFTSSSSSSSSIDCTMSCQNCPTACNSNEETDENSSSSSALPAMMKSSSSMLNVVPEYQSTPQTSTDDAASLSPPSSTALMSVILPHVGEETESNSRSNASEEDALSTAEVNEEAQNKKDSPSLSQNENTQKATSVPSAMQKEATKPKQRFSSHKWCGSFSSESDDEYVFGEEIRAEKETAKINGGKNSTMK